MKRIILTGGGTAGHVTPNIALIPELQKAGYDVQYIGSYDGIEKQLIEKMNIPYHGISSGKLRRYFDPKNFSDPFKVIKGYHEASKLLKQLKPNIIFSKGGFVSVPVIFAAKHRKIPAIIHESDMTPGLANKLSISSATKVCCNFPETLHHLPPEKAVLTGSPIRKELFLGDKMKGLNICNFKLGKPVLFIMGGSLGAAAINSAIRQNLAVILKDFQVIHICGKGKLDEFYKNQKGYVQFEYVQDELKHLLACTDIIISRAGANSICEILALKKPNILIPLSANASRGDQILNSKSFEKLGYSYLLEEENLNSTTLLDAISEVYRNRNDYIQKMNKSQMINSIATIMNLIQTYATK